MMTVPKTITIEILSGVEDGSMIVLDSDNDGDSQAQENQWLLSIGRRDTNDICLRSETFASRRHATLIWQDGQWWLEDLNSTNGTYIENAKDIFQDDRVRGKVSIEIGVPFRIGRTWLELLHYDE